MEECNSNQIISSDDSCDSEMRIMKTELTEFGLDDEHLTKEEMSDLLQAFKNSKESAKDDEKLRELQDEPQKNEIGQSDTPKKLLKRRYVNVRDRRLPWSILPSDLSQSQKAQTLAVYVKLMSISTYHQARQSAVFASWPPPLQIMEETTRIQPIRSTRSGRSVPVYCGFDDDSSDLDFVVSKPKKRKVSTSETNNTDGITKSLSLKRKQSKDENPRPVKEVKSDTDNNEIEIVTDTKLKVKPKIDLFTMLED